MIGRDCRVRLEAAGFRRTIDPMALINTPPTLDRPAALAVAEDIAREAGALLMEGFGHGKRIERKSSALDWVTEYDKASEKLIAGRLRAAFPDHALVGEEGTNSGDRAGYCWYFDPLDGTTNYAHNFPVFCVSMALYHGDDAVLGVIYDPTRDECFTAIAGEGASTARRSCLSRATAFLRPPVRSMPSGKRKASRPPTGRHRLARTPSVFWR